MTITPTLADNAVVLHVSGRLDAITAAEFESTCRQHINPETRKLVLDFEGVEYISSAGLRAILVIGKAMQAGAGALVFSSLRGMAEAVMELGGFYALFPVYDSVEVALESR